MERDKTSNKRSQLEIQTLDYAACPWYFLMSSLNLACPNAMWCPIPPTPPAALLPTSSCLMLFFNASLSPAPPEASITIGKALAIGEDDSTGMEVLRPQPGPRANEAVDDKTGVARELDTLAGTEADLAVGTGLANGDGVFLTAAAPEGGVEDKEGFALGVEGARSAFGFPTAGAGVESFLSTLSPARAFGFPKAAI